MVEQRYEAVMAVLRDGEPVTEVAARLEVNRASVHRWIARYRAGGLGDLHDRSHKPATCPHQMPSDVEALVCDVRRQHPFWGRARLAHEIARRGADPPPSRSAAYRALLRHGLIETRELLQSSGRRSPESQRETIPLDISTRVGGRRHIQGCSETLNMEMRW